LQPKHITEVNNILLFFQHH